MSELEHRVRKNSYGILLNECAKITLADVEKMKRLNQVNCLHKGNYSGCKVRTAANSYSTSRFSPFLLRFPAHSTIADSHTARTGSDIYGWRGRQLSQRRSVRHRAANDGPNPGPPLPRHKCVLSIHTRTLAVP